MAARGPALAGIAEVHRAVAFGDADYQIVTDAGGPFGWSLVPERMRHRSHGPRRGALLLRHENGPARSFVRKTGLTVLVCGRPTRRRGARFPRVAGLRPLVAERPVRQEEQVPGCGPQPGRALPLALLDPSRFVGCRGEWPILPAEWSPCCGARQTGVDASPGAALRAHSPRRRRSQPAVADGQKPPHLAAVATTLRPPRPRRRRQAHRRARPRTPTTLSQRSHGQCLVRSARRRAQDTARPRFPFGIAERQCASASGGFCRSSNSEV